MGGAADGEAGGRRAWRESFILCFAASPLPHFMYAASPETILVRMVGPTASTQPFQILSKSIISFTGIANPTVAAKKIWIPHASSRLSCDCQICCDRPTLTKHMPAAKAPSRCEPIRMYASHPSSTSHASIRKRCTSSRGWIETFFVRAGSPRFYMRSDQ